MSAWDIEERVEDAFVGYLQSVVDADMKVYPAFSDEGIQFPCAVVKAGETEPTSEDAEWHDQRAVAVEIAVITEAAPILSGTGAVMVTTRERNAKARSSVMSALAISTLKDELIKTKTAGVAFSMAQLANTSREVSEEERMLITILNVLVNAEPEELSQ